MKKKVLLMGKSGSGKTSMRSIIFANYVARDTRRLGATIDVEHSHVRFLGNLVLNLWDCGGQESFMDNYITSQKNQIFRNVEILIYVFDVESREFDKDLKYFQNIIQGVYEYSREAKVICLVHKMDLISQDQRNFVFTQKSRLITSVSDPIQPIIFATSIWDETLYQAWSSIVYSLIPNVQSIEANLQKLCKICEAAEVVMFEKATFLVISHAKQEDHDDIHRFEKLSNIIKQFKLSCSKSQTQFTTMEIRTKTMTIFIRPMTSNTYILLMLSDTSIQSAIPIMNLDAARSHFEALEMGK